mmetsp:Transcript_46775/g.141950  ORF Transcript_46775/g.141950 Transcript_46775/m.141950 type:complete len:274 (+) Transcript_46775:849-1670(+)
MSCRDGQARGVAEVAGGAARHRRGHLRQIGLCGLFPGGDSRYSEGARRGGDFPAGPRVDRRPAGGPRAAAPGGGGRRRRAKERPPREGNVGGGSKPADRPRLGQADLVAGGPHHAGGGRLFGQAQGRERGGRSGVATLGLGRWPRPGEGVCPLAVRPVAARAAEAGDGARRARRGLDAAHGLHRQPRHGQDHGGPRGSRAPEGLGPAQDRAPCRGGPRRARGGLQRADSPEDQGRRGERARRRPLHRRGLRARRRGGQGLLRARGPGHPAQAR